MYVRASVCACVGVGRNAGAQECACAFVGLLIHYATRRRHIVAVLSGSIIFFNDFPKKVTDYKMCVLIFCTTFN